ncbi:hypothetical protein [Nodosilinea nodulosa]|uniref:hypothetical protein n=1 Tax=Nodosilinea nodulosa TaxID=416001 RepID=UPI0005933B32|nr:hypothetical protein [Nodosilinea nodulosa]
MVAAETSAAQTQAATLTAAHQTPTYSGQIGHYDMGKGFSDFLFDHDGQVVYLDVFFPDEPEESPYAVSYGDDWFSLWTDCEGQTAPGAPSAAYCLGVFINVEPAGQPGVIWGYNQGAHYLKGYWLVTAHPGMHQGQLSLTLSGAPAQ